MSCIITGGGSGIGQALAWCLAEQGKEVIIIGRREEALASTRSRFPEKITAISADLSQENGRNIVLNELKTIPNLNIDVLVHVAGMIEPLDVLSNVSLAAWKTIQAINVEAPLFLTQKLLPWLPGSRVLMVSSQLAYVAQPCMGAYCVSKAALSMLSQCLNLELQDKNINVSSVTPGIVDTAMFHLLVEHPGISKKHREFYQSVIRNNVWIKPKIAACFIEWLLFSLDKKTFSSQEWDIYDNAHHASWVKDFQAPQPPGFA